MPFQRHSIALFSLIYPITNALNLLFLEFQFQRSRNTICRIDDVKLIFPVWSFQPYISMKIGEMELFGSSLEWNIIKFQNTQHVKPMGFLHFNENKKNKNTNKNFIWKNHYFCTRFLKFMLISCNISWDIFARQ